MCRPAAPTLLRSYLTVSGAKKMQHQRSNRLSASTVQFWWVAVVSWQTVQDAEKRKAAIKEMPAGFISSRHSFV
jgi:hypothetical protein